MRTSLAARWALTTPVATLTIEDHATDLAGITANIRERSTIIEAKDHHATLEE